MFLRPEAHWTLPQYRVTPASGPPVTHSHITSRNPTNSQWEQTLLTTHRTFLVVRRVSETGRNAGGAACGDSDARCTWGSHTPQPTASPWSSSPAQDHQPPRAGVPCTCPSPRPAATFPKWQRGTPWGHRPRPCSLQQTSL